MTHICVSKLASIASDNGLSPGRRQAIIWTNAGILLIWPLGTNFNEILIGIQTFSFKKMHLKMLSAKWRPFCFGLNVLMYSHHLKWCWHSVNWTISKTLQWNSYQNNKKLEQLERLRSEDTPRRLNDYPHYWVMLDPPSQNKVEWPWRYRSRSKVMTCNTPPHASDHLYQIWKESMQNCRRYRADTIFKVKAEWPWKYRSRSKVITCDTPSDANDDLC